MFIDRVGIHFTDREFTFYDSILCSTLTGADTLFTLGNDLETPPGLILDDPGEWRKFCWVYRARGNESHLLLGQFAPPQSVSFQSVTPAWFGNSKSAYYFFDDISVTPISAAVADPLAADTILLCPGSGPAQLSGRPGFNNLAWSTGEVGQSIMVSDTGWYRVTTPLEDCGEIVDSVHVIFPPDATELIETELMSVCSADLPLLLASDYELTWPDGSIGRTFFATTSGNYPVSFSSGCGVVISDTVRITIDTLPAFLLPDTIVICPEDLGSFSLFAPAGLSDYQWSNGSNSPETSPAQAGALTFMGQHPCGLVTASTLVIVPEINISAPWPDTIQACAGALVALELPAVFTDGWTDGFSGNYREVTTSGSYAAQLNHACGSLVLSTVVVFNDPPVINPPEDLELRWGDSVIIAPWFPAGAPVDLMITNEKGEASNYTIFDYFRPQYSGLYMISALGQGNCTVNGSVFVNLNRNRRFYLPNAFSPNFDGINDVLELFPGPAVQALSDISVYDRWGGRIFEQRSLPGGHQGMRLWDGKTPSGEILPSGAYLVTLELTYFDGSREQISREVMVIR